MENKPSKITRLDELFSEELGFSTYLIKSGIDPERYRNILENYIQDGKRCLRVRNVSEFENIFDLLKKEFSSTEKHPIMRNLLLLDRTIKVNNLDIFKQKKVCGMEASSALVVSSK